MTAGKHLANQQPHPVIPAKPPSSHPVNTASAYLRKKKLRTTLPLQHENISRSLI